MPNVITPAYRAIFVRFNDYVVAYGSSGAYAAIPTSTETNLAASYDAKTFEIKFNPSNSITSRAVLYEQGGSGNGMCMYIHSGKLYGGMWSDLNGWSAFVSATIPNQGHRYYAVMVYDNASGLGSPQTATLSLYLQHGGQPFDAKFDEVATGLGQMSAHANPGAMGAVNASTRHHDSNRSGTGSDGFNGNITEMRQWNKALTLSEIRSSINANYNGTETDLVALWKYNDGSGTTITDETGNHDATLTGTGYNWQAT